MIFSIPSFTKGDVCPLDGRWYLSSWMEKANFPPEKILQQNKEQQRHMLHLHLIQVVLFCKKALNDAFSVEKTEIMCYNTLVISAGIQC